MMEIDVAINMVPGTCDMTSLEELKAYANEVSSLYQKDKEVTEENLKDAKSDLALFRNVIKKCESNRIAMHNEYEKPYEDWLSSYKEAISPINEVIEDLSGKTKAVESAQETQRITFITDMILRDADDIRKGLGETVKSNQSLWNRVCKRSYYNKSGSQVKNTEEWRTTLLGISRDLDVIGQSKDKDNLLISYLRLGDLALAMQDVEETKRKLASVTKEKEPEAKASESITLDIPDESTVPPQDQKQAKALRWIVGPKWKIMLLFKAGAMLGLTFANYEEKR